MNQGQHNGGQHGAKVGTGIPEGASQGRQVNQRSHRHDNRRCQRGLGQPGNGRRQEQGGQGNAHRRIGSRRRRFRAGIKVDHGAGEATGYRHTSGETGTQVGGAQANQLLVRINTLAPLGGQRLAHRHRFHKAHHTDQQGTDGQLGPYRGLQAWHGKGGQTRWHGTHQPDTLFIQPQGPGHQGCHHHCQNRCRLGENIRGTGRQAQLAQQRLQVATGPHQEQQGTATHQQSGQIGISQAA